LFGLGSLVLLAAILWALMWWLRTRHYEWSDDAFIDARQFAVSAKVSGYVAEVPVSDNQVVIAGTKLVQIDARDYQAALSQAEARLAEAKATVLSNAAQLSAQEAQVKAAEDQQRQADAALDFARQENDRAQKLLQTAAGTIQHAEQTQSQF